MDSSPSRRIGATSGTTTSKRDFNSNKPGKRSPSRIPTYDKELHEQQHLQSNPLNPHQQQYQKLQQYYHQEGDGNPLIGKMISTSGSGGHGGSGGYSRYGGQGVQGGGGQQNRGSARSGYAGYSRDPRQQKAPPQSTASTAAHPQSQPSQPSTHSHAHQSSHTTSAATSNTQAQQSKQANQITKLSQKLSQYTRGMDRRMVLRTLRGTKDPNCHLPTSVVLKPVIVEDIAEAEREAAMERGVLNGVKFLKVEVGTGGNQPSGKTGGSSGSASVSSVTSGTSNSTNKENTQNESTGAGTMDLIEPPTDSYFLQTLREICGHMCDMEGVYGSDPMALYGGLLLRLSRSAGERDALEVVTRWLGGKELVVMPVKRRHHCRQQQLQQLQQTQQSQQQPHPKGGKSNNNINDTPPNPSNFKLSQPLEVELYVESGNIHAKVTMLHEFGLFRKADLESHGVDLKSMDQWNQLVVQQVQLMHQYPHPPPLSSHSHQKSQQLQYQKTLQAHQNQIHSITTSLQQIQYQLLLSNPLMNNMKPWVFVDAEVMERINFGTGNSVRQVFLRVPEGKNSGYHAVC